jgi:hypothetical protein
VRELHQEMRESPGGLLGDDCLTDASLALGEVRIKEPKVGEECRADICASTMPVARGGVEGLAIDKAPNLLEDLVDGSHTSVSQILPSSGAKIFEQALSRVREGRGAEEGAGGGDHLLDDEGFDGFVIGVVALGRIAQQQDILPNSWAIFLSEDLFCALGMVRNG